MQLEKLELYNFRNLKNQTLTFPSRISIFVGKNGQGKTNIVEAVHLLSGAKEKSVTLTLSDAAGNGRRKIVIDRALVRPA